jgi:nuclease HARBI1
MNCGTCRFTVGELIELVDVLEIPPIFHTASHSKFDAIEALCLLCVRFKTPADQFDLTTKYDRCQSAISEVVNELVLYLDKTWKHLLDFDVDFLLSPEQLAAYAQAIHWGASRDCLGISGLYPNPKLSTYVVPAPGIQWS